MKIALITNNFLPNTGGITTTILNFYNKLTKIGENVYVLNKTYEDNENLCFKVLSNTMSLKGFFNHNIKFLHFLFYLSVPKKYPLDIEKQSIEKHHPLHKTQQNNF